MVNVDIGHGNGRVLRNDPPLISQLCVRRKTWRTSGHAIGKSDGFMYAAIVLGELFQLILI